jgi:predicted nucleic acid-binding protein
MGIILDTSIIIEAERGRLDLERFVTGREAEPFGLSIITVAELLHGVERADTDARRLQRSAFVEKVIEIFPLYPIDLQTTRVYASIWANLHRHGTLIGAHDMLIGATAIAHGFSIATFNQRHFSRIPGLRIEILSES